jgi:hypothetical protein
VATQSLTFDIYGRDKTASKTINGIGDSANRVADGFKKFGQIAAAALAVAAVAAVKFGVDSVQAFAEAEQSQNRLEDAFKRFPKLADTNIESLRKLNEELAKKTRFDDDAFAVGQSVLAQYELTGAQLKELTPLLADYAAKTGKDLPTAAEDLGKALLGQGRALKAIGIDFQDTGSVAGNFDQIMAGLRSQVGGFAETDAATAAGQLEILRNRFGEVQEKIGEALMPALSGLMTVVEEDLLPILEEFANWFVSDGLPALQGFFAFLSENKESLIPIAIGLGAITAALWAMNVALYANPIVLAIAGIVAGLTWLGATIAWVATDFQGASGTVVSASEYMVNALKNGWNQITTWFGQLIAAFANGWGQIVGAFSNGASQISGFVSSISSNLASFVGQAIATLAQLPGQIMGIFASAGSWLFSAGANIVMGLVNGIRSAIGAAAAAAAQMAASAIAAAKSALNINSPSKVFREIGLSVGEGYVQGIDRSVAGAALAVEAMVAVPSTVGSGGGAVAVSNVSSTVTNVFNNTFTTRNDDPRVAATILGREFARRAAG